MSAIRNALGADAPLLVDANSCNSPRRAIQVGSLLQEQGVSHFEEPCPYRELKQTKEVRDALAIDVTGGEQDDSLPHWRYMIEIKAVDIVEPDVCCLRGMACTFCVARLAHDAGLPCTPHSARVSLVTPFAMQLLGATPSVCKYLELSIEGADCGAWQEGLFVEPRHAVRDGHVTIPGAPGRGVEIAPRRLGRASYHRCELH